AATAAALRSFLQQRLPAYLIPAAFVWLESFPCTPNGKLDRHALPRPETQRPDEAGPYVAPRTPLEEVLAGFWEEVLQVGRVGAHEHFFGLGGHSLAAVRVVARVRTTLGLDLPLLALFEAPTLTELTERVAALQRQGEGTTPPLERVCRDGDLPLSFGQQRL